MIDDEVVVRVNGAFAGRAFTALILVACDDSRSSCEASDILTSTVASSPGKWKIIW